MFWNVINTILREFLSYPLQLIIGGAMFCIHAPRRKYWLLTLIPFAALMLTLNYLYIYHVYTSAVMGEINVILIFAALLLAIGLSFKLDLKQTIFIGSGSYALQHFINSVTSILRDTVFANTPSEGGWACLANVVYLAVSVCAFYGFHRIFVRWMLSRGGLNGFANLRDIYIILLSAITVAIVCVLSIFASRTGKDVYHNVYACACCLMLMFLQFGIFAQGAERKKSETAKELLDYEHEQRELAKETIEILNRECHDLKHRIEGIRKIINDETLDGKLKELYDTARIYDTFLNTGNSALDVLLTEKNLYCNKYGIRFTCIADGNILGFMSDEDIYCLFGNALDNAIESVKEETDNRWISLNLHGKNGFVVFHTDNYCANQNDIKYKNGLPLTTRVDGTKHGQGTVGMKYVAEKYGGTLTVGCEENVFSLNVIIPIP